jgi:hypothetical protein
VGVEGCGACAEDGEGWDVLILPRRPGVLIGILMLRFVCLLVVVDCGCCCAECVVYEPGESRSVGLKFTRAIVGEQKSDH